MSGVVVDNDVNVEFPRDIGIDMPKKLKELLVSVSLLALSHDLTVCYVQGREQRGRTVPDVVVSNPFQVA